MPYESGTDDNGSQVDGLSGYFSCFLLYSRKGGSIAFRGFHGMNERMREPIKLAEGRLSRQSKKICSMDKNSEPADSFAALLAKEPAAL